MARHIGEDRQRAGDHHCRHDRQTVKAVSEVDRVTGAGDHEIAEQHEATEAERIGHVLEEGHDQRGLRGIGRRQAEHQCAGQRNHRGPKILPAAGQPFRVAVHHLAPVIHPAHGAKTERDQQRHPNIMVAQITPQQCGEADGDENQRAAHGRRTRLGEVRLGAIVAHRLTNFLRRQPPDYRRPENEGDRQRRQRCQHRTQRDVAEHVEGSNVLAEPQGEFKQHAFPPRPRSCRSRPHWPPVPCA